MNDTKISDRFNKILYNIGDAIYIESPSEIGSEIGFNEEEQEGTN